MAAPRISQLGGGIRKDQVGASTAAYEEYFDGHHGAGAQAGNAERTGNYADVVNKCVPHNTAAAQSHAAACQRWGCTAPVGSRAVAPLTPSFGPSRYYDLATSFYEYGWVRVLPGATDASLRCGRVPLKNADKPRSRGAAACSWEAHTASHTHLPALNSRAAPAPCHLS